MKTWIPTTEQTETLERYGYCILPNVISRDEAMMIKGAILDHIYQPEVSSLAAGEADPMDPMAMDSQHPDALQARLRKLGKFGLKSPLLWHQFYGNEAVLAIARHFLESGDITLKFNSCFLKPARTGSATPWHQDNGLWRDGDRSSFNIWMAIDPATRENGCMQFIPDSHRGEIVPHLLYPGGIHGELPREHVQEMSSAHGLHHLELEPGSAVCWHSNLYHYSPPNASERSRIAIAGVYSSVAEAAANRFCRQHVWALRGGEPVRAFPAEPFRDYAVVSEAPPPYPPVAA